VRNEGALARLGSIPGRAAPHTKHEQDERGGVVSGVTAGVAGSLVVTPTVGEPLATDPQEDEVGRQRLRDCLEEGPWTGGIRQEPKTSNR
jgi:hypothetical protein